MRSAPLTLAAAADEALEDHGPPDVVLCSDMLDLPQWRGMRPGSRWAQVPAAVYFHENQWTYPQSPAARLDSHFGYTNLLTALAADACYFNSRFHRDEFLTASEAFVRRMPDSRAAHDFTSLRRRCHVYPPGFDPPERLPAPTPTVPPQAGRTAAPLRIGWVSRWEYDKRPDRLLPLLEQLQRLRVDFELVLLGERPRAVPASLTQLRTRFPDQLVHDGFAPSRDQYWDLLQSIDVVVSTADHEFFGIAVCEAVWAGAVPLLPARLSYPELTIADCLYESLDEAAEKLGRWASDPDLRGRLRELSRQAVQPLAMVHTVPRLDDALADLLEGEQMAG